MPSTSTRRDPDGRAPVITLVLGGTRSGKSEVAEALVAAAAGGQRVTYVATGSPSDQEMAARIAAHRARRPDGWVTVDAGSDLVTVLAGVDGPALVDSLGAWVAAHPDLAPDVGRLGQVLRTRTATTVVVSEEVGLGVHAPTEAGRRFADALGELNRAVADIASDVLLVVAGRVLPLGRAGDVVGPGAGPASGPAADPEGDPAAG